jgi:hypothetical protein
MKTIVETATGQSKYLFADDETLVITADSIAVGDPLEFRIGDLNSSNITLYENVTNAPDDWFGCKYTFDGTTWAVSDDWVEPETKE